MPATPGCSALRGMRVESPDKVGDAWDSALAADRPVLLEFITDPEVPPLPPHIRFEQAQGMAKALASRDPASGQMVQESLKGKLAEFVNAMSLVTQPAGRARTETAQRGNGGERAADRAPRSTSTTTAGRSATSGCGRRCCSLPALTCRWCRRRRLRRAARTVLPALSVSLPAQRLWPACTSTCAASRASPAAFASRPTTS